MRNVICILCFLLLMVGVVYSLPIGTHVSPTQSNDSYVVQDWIYVNITTDEDLNQSLLEIGNASGSTANFSMTNSSLTTWYLNTTGQADGKYNYSIYMQNTTGDWNRTGLMDITLDTISPVVNDIDSITNGEISQSVLFVNGTCTDTNIDFAYTNTSEYNTTDSTGAIFNFTNTGITLTTKRHDILITCNDSANNTGTNSTYYYYVGTDHYMTLGEDYDNAILFNTDQTSVHTTIPIQINNTSSDTSMYNHTINTSQDWTSLNINFTPMTIGSGHNAFLYIEGSGEVIYFDDNDDCSSVGTDKIKCMGTGINVDASGFNKFISYTSSVTLVTPADNLINTSTNTTQGFVFSATNTYSDTLLCDLMVNDTLVFRNTSVVDGVETTFYSNTSLDNTSYTWYIQCGGHNSSVRTLWIDNVAPVIDDYGYSNVSSGTLDLNYTVTENDTDTTCTFYLYNNKTTDSVSGVWNESTGRIRICEKMLTADDLTYEGFFITGVKVIDTMSNSLEGTNQTNFTSVKLYSGWTAVQVDRNISMDNFSDMHEGITQLSYYNNTAKSFITYVVGLSTNADTTLYDGDFVFAQVTTDTSFLRQYTVDYGSIRNSTYTKGWNQASAWNYTTSYPSLEVLCDEAISNSSVDITHIAWWESINQRYTVHVCGFTSNSGVEVPLGQGYFIRTNGTTNQVRNR